MRSVGLLMGREGEVTGVIVLAGVGLAEGVRVGVLVGVLVGASVSPPESPESLPPDHSMGRGLVAIFSVSVSRSPWSRGSVSRSPW